MNPKYPHTRWTAGRRVALGLVVFLSMIFSAGGLFVYRELRAKDTVVQGVAKTVPQTVADSNKKFIVTEPFFTFELPGDWKEQGRTNVAGSRSITWTATKKNYDNRTVTLYLDVSASNIAVNKILPLEVQGDRVSPTDISDNCTTYTSLTPADKKKQADAAGGVSAVPAKWNGVDFLCEFGSIIDNRIGASAATTNGVLNQFTVTGPKSTKRSYFIVYADRNVRPDPTIFKDMLQTFRAL